MAIIRMSRTKQPNGTKLALKFAQMPDEAIERMIEGVQKRIEVWHGINRLILAKNYPERYTEQKTQLTQKENIVPLIEVAGDESEESRVKEEAKNLLEEIRKEGCTNNKFYVPKDVFEIITDKEVPINIRLEAIKWFRGIEDRDIRIELECISNDMCEYEEICYEAKKALNWYNLQ